MSPTRKALLTLATLGLAVFAAHPASAQTVITGLFNTGVNSVGAVATTGSVDQHYTQVSIATATFNSNGTVASTGTPKTAPAAAFLYNNSVYAPATNAQYITTDANGGQAFNNGFYVADYQTTFDLTGLNPSSAVITGQWSTDNRGTDILINGKSTGLKSGDFSAPFTSFSLAPFQSDFKSGANTLDFVWNNQGGPGAIAVQNLQGTASAAPEPSQIGMLALVALGLGALAVKARKRSTAAQAA